VTKQKKRPPVHDSRPLTPEEERAVVRQGETLAWVRQVTERHGGSPEGLWTRGVCGGSESR
jgi:hypothetical protein